MKVLFVKTVVKKLKNSGIHAEIIAHIVYILNMLMLTHGDRSEDCHGMLEPIGLEIDSKKGYVIVFRCKKCGMIRKNKAAKDDDMNEIIKLSAKH